MITAAIVLWILFGHVAIWVAVYNRLHSWGIPRPAVLAGSAVAIGALLAGPVGFVGGILSGLWEQLWDTFLQHLSWSAIFSAPLWIPVGAVYALVCLAKATSVFAGWVKAKLSRPPEALRHLVRWQYPVAKKDLVQNHHSWSDRLLLSLPGNQSLEVELVDLAVEVPQLPEALDRLRVVQLSDLHLSGRVPRSYFEHVIDIVNDQDPDFVFLTGDLVEKWEYLAWAEELLSQLRAEYGCYFVLGNHDMLLDVNALRRALQEAGHVDLGGRVVEVPITSTWGKRAGGAFPRLYPADAPAEAACGWHSLPRVILAGSEEPWLGRAPSLGELNGRRQGALILALAHTPDQIVWARKEGVHLLLAGHLHGGQIRLPGIGPVVSPSRFGTRFNAGLYYWPPTLFYVSRGLSARFPLRWQARPEVTCLTLRAPTTRDLAAKASAQFVEKGHV